MFHTAGFDFSNSRRNQHLVEPAHPPRARKTGTTIVGVVFKGGVVLGADTRATEGDTVADKNCEKIHYIADNIWCCGAGTSAGKTAAARRREGLPGIPELATRAARRYRFDDSTDLLAAGAAPAADGTQVAGVDGLSDAETKPVPVPGPCVRGAGAGWR